MFDCSVMLLPCPQVSYGVLYPWLEYTTVKEAIYQLDSRGLWETTTFQLTGQVQGWVSVLITAMSEYNTIFVGSVDKAIDMGLCGVNYNRLANRATIKWSIETSLCVVATCMKTCTGVFWKVIFKSWFLSRFLYFVNLNNSLTFFIKFYNTIMMSLDIIK